MQCSAHVQVHLVTERHHREVFVVDTFIYPTKELALLVRTDVERAGSLGIVSATRGYIDLTRLRDGRGRALQAGRRPPPAGRRLRRWPDPPAPRREHPELLRVEEDYGAVDTTWVVYGSASASAASSSGSVPRGFSLATRTLSASTRSWSAHRAPSSPPRPPALPAGMLPC